MRYQQAIEYLTSLNRFGINLGLARIEKLLALMQHPERRFKTIHVTGTNGKGSTTAMIASMLQAAGIRTGMYTSPHLVDYTERMLVDGEAVSRDGFAEAIAFTRRFVDIMTAEGGEHPTEFEVLTAAAFHVFAAAGVEYAVIEVGLGGLVDSTNVIEPLVSVITNVALEHTDKCGDTLEAIAVHKAGIIKTGVPAVTAATGAALTVIERRAQEQDSPLYRLGVEFFFTSLGSGLQGQMLEWRQQGHSPFSPLSIHLLGRHQLANAAVAVMAMRCLAAKDSRITADTIRQGLAEAKWPGRFEVVPAKPPYIIDGAHNPAGAQSLRQGLDDYFPGKAVTFVLGILKDKDQAGVIRELIRAGDRVIVVRPVTERACEPAILAEQIRQTVPVAAVIAETLPGAIEQATGWAGTDGVVCITGSLYLVGPARRIVYSGGQNSPREI